MNVKILFTFQVIFIYKSYWLLIFKSEKDKSYSLIGVQGMLVVPNCWDVGTWGWLERKIESLFYEWTHLYMDLADVMVNLPYKWTFLSDWSKYIFIYVFLFFTPSQTGEKVMLSACHELILLVCYICGRGGER